MSSPVKSDAVLTRKEKETDSPSPVLQRRGLNPIWTENKGHDCYKLHRRGEKRRREGKEMRKASFTLPRLL